METLNKQQEMYEYRLLTVFDEEGRGNDYSIEDVEHYRDSLV